MELSAVYMRWKLHSDCVLQNVYILCWSWVKILCGVDIVRRKVNVLRALGISNITCLCVSLWWDLCVGGVRACQDNLGSQTSFSPYEFINKRPKLSCLINASASCLICGMTNISCAHAGIVCVPLLTINSLCSCHIPLLTILSSTVGCGGNKSFHTLNAYQLGAVHRPEKQADNFMLQNESTELSVEW